MYVIKSIDLHCDVDLSWNVDCDDDGGLEDVRSGSGWDSYVARDSSRVT